jgi:hypothetical protein
VLDGAAFGRHIDAVMQLRHIKQAEPPPEPGQGGWMRGRGFGLADQAEVTEDTGMLMTTDTHHDQQCRPHSLGSPVCFIASASHERMLPAHCSTEPRRARHKLLPVAN